MDKLGSLTLKNNPCASEEYPSYVVAHLPNLVYIDYRRITEDESREAISLHRCVQSMIYHTLVIVRCNANFRPLLCERKAKKNLNKKSKY